MTTALPEPSVPQEIASRYGLGAVRFQSAMATLYEARDPETGAAAVLKVLRTEAILSVPERQRVRRELTKLSTLRHDSLASVLCAPGAGAGAGTDTGNSLWFARLWVPGENLRERIQRVGPVTPGEAAHVASRIAGALGELHRQGVLHRDLRAGHVILGPEDKVHLLDPAVGRMFKSPEGRPIVGAPGSVAPEAIAGKLVSFRSDLYGLGVVLYEMLTGAPPFDPDDPEVLKKQSESDPAPLPDSVPAAFARLVSSLLSRDARERPFSAQQLERQLEPLVDLADPRRSLPPPVYFAPALSPSLNIASPETLGSPSGQSPNAVTLPSISISPLPLPQPPRASAPPPVPAIARRPSAPTAPAEPTTPAPIEADFDIDIEDSARTLLGAPSSTTAISTEVLPKSSPIESPPLPIGIIVPDKHEFESSDEAPTKVSSVQELQASLGQATLNGTPPPAGLLPSHSAPASASPAVPGSSAPQPPSQSLSDPAPLSADAQSTRPRIPSIPPIPTGAPRLAPGQPPSGYKSTLMGLAMVNPESLLDGAQPPAGSVMVPPRRQNLDYDDVSDTTVSEDSRQVASAISPAINPMNSGIPGAPDPSQRANSTLLGVMAPTVQASYPPQAPSSEGAYPQQFPNSYPPQSQNPYPQQGQAPHGSWAPPAPNAWQPQQPSGQPSAQGYPSVPGYPQASYPQTQGYSQSPNAPTQVLDEPPRSSGVPAAVWIIAALALIMIPGVGGFALARYISQRNAESDLPTLTVVPPSSPGANTPETLPNSALEPGSLPVPPPMVPSPVVPSPVVPSPVVPSPVAPPELPTPEPTAVNPSPEPLPVAHQPTEPVTPPSHTPDHPPAANPEPTRHGQHARSHGATPPEAHRPTQVPPTQPPVLATNNPRPPTTPPAVAPPPSPTPAPGPAATGDLNDAMRRRDWAAAARILEGQVRAQPTSALLHSQLGSMYERAGQPQRALSEYRTALRYDRRNVGTMHRLADTQLSTGDRSGAIETFRQILVIAPNDPAATARLAALQGGGR